MLLGIFMGFSAPVLIPWRRASWYQRMWTHIWKAPVSGQGFNLATGPCGGGFSGSGRGGEMGGRGGRGGEIDGREISSSGVGGRDHSES